MLQGREGSAVEIDPAEALVVAHRSLPYFLGLFVSWSLHGASVVLLPNYLFQFRRNPLRERVFITALVALNTVDVGFDLSRVIKVYVLHFGDPVWLVSIHKYMESSLLYFSPVFLILLSQMYLVRRVAIFLRHVGGTMQEWRIVIGALLGLAVGGSAICGFVSQYDFFGYQNYIVAVAAVSESSGHLYNVTHIMWMLLGLLGTLGIALILSLELSRTRAWQRQMEQAPRIEKFSGREDWGYISLRNGSPVLLISLVTLILFLTQNKAWTFATGSLLPRVYSITVIVWTALPRPRSGEPYRPNDPPDLTWTTATDRPSVEVHNKLSPSRVWTMLVRPSLPGARGLRKKVSPLRRGRSKAQPKQWFVDLEADLVEKIDLGVFGNAHDDVSAAAALAAEPEDSTELQAWRASMRLGKAQSSFSSSSPAANHHLSALRQRTSLSSESPALPVRQEESNHRASVTTPSLGGRAESDAGSEDKDK